MDRGALTTYLAASPCSRCNRRPQLSKSWPQTKQMTLRMVTSMYMPTRPMKRRTSSHLDADQVSPSTPLALAKSAVSPQVAAVSLQVADQAAPEAACLVPSRAPYSYPYCYSLAPLLRLEVPWWQVFLSAVCSDVLASRIRDFSTPSVFDPISPRLPCPRLVLAFLPMLRPFRIDAVAIRSPKWPRTA